MNKGKIAQIWIVVIFFSISLIIYVSELKDNNINYSSKMLIMENLFLIILCFIISMFDDEF